MGSLSEAVVQEDSPKKYKALPPQQELEALADKVCLDLYSEKFAETLDQRDPLRSFRSRFAYPRRKTRSQTSSPPCDGEEEGEECVYLCGNSLGLKPKSADERMRTQLDKWATMAVEMHFKEPLPAAACDSYGRESLGRLVGADPSSVILMNALTVNLNLLMLSFYQPTKQRYKILIEGKAFPSDRYAVRSQLELRGYSHEEGLLQLQPREGEYTLRNEDIIEFLEREGPSIALVCLGGVQYYTGQKFDMEAVTAAAKKQGCVVGWDLAHAVGNVELRLDEWDVDFASWCSYKYLNSGAGGIAGAYVNKKHEGRPMTCQLHGWWSNRQETRFQMLEECDASPGVEGFRMSNPSPFLVTLVLASLEIFDEAGMPRLLEKQRLLTGYLEMLLIKYFSSETVKSGPTAKIITPRDPGQRGCQLSLSFSTGLQKVHEQLEHRGVVCDVRQPNVMRLAPAPLYNSFKDVHRFVDILRDVFDNLPSETPLREG